MRSFMPRFSSEARQSNTALVEELGRIGARKHATAGQIALAWLLARKPWIVPIPGTRKVSRLEENLGAVNIELTADDIQEIESVVSSDRVVGPRYAEREMGLVDR